MDPIAIDESVSVILIALPFTPQWERLSSERSKGKLMSSLL